MKPAWHTSAGTSNLSIQAAIVAGFGERKFQLSKEDYGHVVQARGPGSQFGPGVRLLAAAVLRKSRRQGNRRCKWILTCFCLGRRRYLEKTPSFLHWCGLHLLGRMMAFSGNKSCSSATLLLSGAASKVLQRQPGHFLKSHIVHTAPLTAAKDHGINDAQHLKSGITAHCKGRNVRCHTRKRASLKQVGGPLRQWSPAAPSKGAFERNCFQVHRGSMLAKVPDRRIGLCQSANQEESNNEEMDGAGGIEGAQSEGNKPVSEGRFSKPSTMSRLVRSKWWFGVLAVTLLVFGGAYGYLLFQYADIPIIVAQKAAQAKL